MRSKAVSIKTGKKPRADSQMSSLSGEFFVAAELLKRHVQTSVTFGNAKSIDLLTHNALTGKSFSVQVKSLQKRNYFVLNPAKVNRACVYVFVLLNKPGVPVEFFIVPGSLLLTNPLGFDKDFRATCTVPGINWKSPMLGTFKDNWAHFLV
jgi:hypothetical protein